MAIDTYVVAIEPKFNTAAFKKIKSQIESLSTTLKSIPISVKFTNAAFAGLKSKINSEIKKGNYNVTIPIKFSLPSSALKNLNNQLKGISLKSFNYPVKFSLRGAKTDLLNQLKGLSFKPITIPARVVIQGGVQGNPNLPNYNQNSGGRRAAQSNLTDVIKNVGIYGLAQSSYNYIGKNIAAPFLIEQDLYSLLAIEQYKKESLQGIRDVVIAIGRELPIKGPDVSEAILKAARGDVSPVKLVGKYEDIHGNTRYDYKKSQIYVASKLAAYSGEKVQDIVKLLKLLNEALPNIDVKKWGNLLAGAADISSWSFSEMSQYTQSASVGGIKGMNVDPLTYLGIMAWQSKMNKRPGQAADSLRVFNNFTQWAKSERSEENMEILGLQRYNPEGTQLQNFRNYLFDLNNIYKELSANGNYITRTYDKEVKTGRGKNKVVSIKRVTSKFSRQEVGKMLYEIAGSDAIKFASSLNNNELPQIIEAFDKLLTGADLDKKLAIVSQSAIYKLQLLSSEIEAAFTEAFDLTTIKNIGNIFKEISLWVKDLSNSINEAGGLSGYLELLKGEFSGLIEGISMVASAIVNVANFINKIFGKPLVVTTPFVSGMWEQENPFDKSTKENLKRNALQLSSLIEKETAGGNPSIFSQYLTPPATNPTTTVNNNGNVTVNVNGSGDPAAVAKKVTFEITNAGTNKRLDNLILEDASAFNGF